MSARESRLVAVLVLLVVLALVWLGAVAPVLAGFADRAETRRELALRYAANDRTIAAIPRLARTARADGQRLATTTLAAPDEATASEILRERMQAAVNAAGGAFRGGEDVPAAIPTTPGGKAAPALPLATARITARLTERQLDEALLRLQAAPPFVIVTGVEVNSTDAATTGTASSMDVTLEARIAWHVATSPAAPAR